MISIHATALLLVICYDRGVYRSINLRWWAALAHLLGQYVVLIGYLRVA